MSANWNNPVVGSAYANFVTEVKDRDVDQALGFDPAYTTPTNLPTNTVRWTSAANRWEKWNGSAWVVLSSGYAINITGKAANITGVAAAANGGTGQSSYTIGDLLYASGATALSKLAAVATGNVMISGGTATAPSWGKVGLTTHVSGTLAVGNGGTGAGTFTSGGLLRGNGTGALTIASAADIVAAIGATKVQAASAADNGGVTSVNGQTGAVTVTAGVTSVAGKTGAVTLAKGDVGLGNVDNTADASKSVYYANSAGSAGNADTVDGYHYNQLPYVGKDIYQWGVGMIGYLKRSTNTGGYTNPNDTISGSYLYCGGNGGREYRVNVGAWRNIGTVTYDGEWGMFQRIS